jgi:hypothetical protein
VSVIAFEAEALPATNHPLYFHVLGIQGGAITYQHSASGTSFAHSVPNIGPTYDRLALVVASRGNQTNFDYGINLADGLFIQKPTTAFPAAVGEATSPKKFVLQVQVLDEQGDPVVGIDPFDFVIRVDGVAIHPTANPANSPIVSASFIAGQYWLSVRAPATPGCNPCDLTVEYEAFSATETAALAYGPVPDSDNMIVIDRSGSMAGAKIAAAKEAGRLYVDAYDTGDRIGVLSYNDGTDLEYGLASWNNATRAAAQAAIDAIAAPVGATAIGLGLRDAQQELIDLGSPNPAWSMVLLSDGADTVADDNDRLPAFLQEYEDRKDNGDQVPVIHVIAVGDDADGVALEELARKANGEFQWLSDVGLGAGEAFSNELGEIYRGFAEAVLDEQQVKARRDALALGNILQIPDPGGRCREPGRVRGQVGAVQRPAAVPEPADAGRRERGIADPLRPRTPRVARPRARRGRLEPGHTSVLRLRRRHARRGRTHQRPHARGLPRPRPGRAAVRPAHARARPAERYGGPHGRRRQAHGPAHGRDADDVRRRQPRRRRRQRRLLRRDDPEHDGLGGLHGRDRGLGHLAPVRCLRAPATAGLLHPAAGRPGLRRTCPPGGKRRTSSTRTHRSRARQRLRQGRPQQRSRVQQLQDRPAGPGFGRRRRERRLRSAPRRRSPGS